MVSDFAIKREYLFTSDNLIQITGCPIFYLLEFQDLLTLLNKELTAWQTVNCSVSEMLLSSPKIKLICERIFRIHNSQFTIHNLEQLLFGKEPLLLKVNGMLEAEEKEIQNQSIEEFIATTITGLVSTQLASNLSEAIAISKQYSADIIWTWLQARSYQLDPKSKPMMSKSQEKQLLEELSQEMSSGSFFDDFPFPNVN